MAELALCLLHWQSLKKVWQLYSMAHDGIGLFVPQMFADIQAIVRVVEVLNCFCGA